MDREKVVKGIDICLNRFHCGADCPYYDGNGCQEQLRQDALALLKEQETVSITTDYFDGFGNRTSHCPSCNSRLVWHQNKNYCGECGQAVKWEV